MGTLVIDEDAIATLDAAQIEEKWFSDFFIPTNAQNIRRTIQGNHIYLLSDKADTSSGLLVIDTEIFSQVPNNIILFERIMRTALRHFDRGISIPINWQPYHAGSRLSIYAQPSQTDTHRVYFEQSPDNSQNLFVFAISLKPQKLITIPINIDLYRSSINDFVDAAISEDLENTPDVGDFGILLSEPLRVELARAGTLAEWCSTKLNSDQLKFVNTLPNRPIRLRGAAGTGKTQAMAIKCLRDFASESSTANNFTFAFLTHSSSLAHDVIRELFYSLDPSGSWSQAVEESNNKRIWVGTLYELAQDKLDYVLKGLRPLALDGHEGREYQHIIIDESIEQALKDPRIIFQYLKKAPGFEQYLKSKENRALVISELANEFAAVLDAESIKIGTPAAEKYIKSARESWQFNLKTPEERRIVLEIHDIYKNKLKSSNYLSLDQMIQDFAQYLSMHSWEQLKDRDGFDVIFVDEYHYFNKSEAMLLHNLFKSRAQHDGKWPLIMAYDLKQSTTDAPLGGGLERFRNPGVGESKSFELTQVYRSTPEITELLRNIDAAFPGIDLEGDYSTRSYTSSQANGETPKVHTFDSTDKLLKSIFEISLQISKKSNSSTDFKVAILCLNDEVFDKYSSASVFSQYHIPVRSREDLKAFKYAKSRPIFSMPDYVAGLQFDTVFIIGADAADYPDEPWQTTSRRRYVSRLYVGASRAVRTLAFGCSAERGGISPILKPFLEKGILAIQ